MDSSGPIGRQPYKLKVVGLVSMRHEQQRRRRPIVSFVELECSMLEMAFSGFVSLQQNIAHSAFLSPIAVKVKCWTPPNREALERGQSRELFAVAAVQLTTLLPAL